MNKITKADLSQFTGTENWYPHFTGMLYTDGIKFLAQNAEAYWLIHEIASYQQQLQRDEMLADFQIWILSVVGEGERDYPFLLPQEGKKALLTCWKDTPQLEMKPSVRHQIVYTDFPLIELKLYVSSNVLMLPSEY